MYQISSPESNSRIILRQLKGNDVTHDYVSWLNDPTINQFLEVRHTVQTFEIVKEYVESLSQEDSCEILFGIFVKDSDLHVGNIKLGPINYSHSHATIGLIIGNKDYWGKGFGTEAIKLLTQWSIKTLGLSSLHAGCYSDNVGSFKAFLKAGWSHVGTIPSYWSSGLSNKRNDELLLAFNKQTH